MTELRQALAEIQLLVASVLQSGYGDCLEEG
jgi:hypothetical protein